MSGERWDDYYLRKGLESQAISDMYLKGGAELESSYEGSMGNAYLGEAERHARESDGWLRRAAAKEIEFPKKS